MILENCRDACQRLSSYYQDIIWYHPTPQQRTILLLPTPNSWETLAYIDWYGRDSIGTTVAMALLKQWQESYQADLVYHYGTILEFVVQQPPTDAEDTFGLAFEQFVLAPWILYSSGISLRSHALFLMNNNVWRLEEKP